MSDELRDRFRALDDATRGLAPYGLADVRRRRVRRQRNAAVGISLGVVAVIGSAAFILHPTGDPQSIAPIGRATSSLTAGDARTATPTETAANTATNTASNTPTTLPTTTEAAASTGRTSPTSSAAAGSSGSQTSASATLVVGPGSLLTVAQLEAAGLATRGPATADRDGAPSLPTMCTGSSWQEQYSGPSDFVSQDYPLSDGTLTEDVLGYNSDAEANLALVKLKDDARACPTINEFATITVSAVGQGIGDEFVLFTLHQESGQDGSITNTSIVIARSANVLVSVAAPTETEARSGAAAGVTQVQSS